MLVVSTNPAAKHCPAIPLVSTALLVITNSAVDEH